MRFTLLFVLCSITISLFAGTETGPLKINGTVLENKQPVPYATVSVLSLPDSNLVTGAISDENGEFEIKNLKKGKYLLKVDFLGYESIYKNLGEIEKNTDVGGISLLQGAQKLNEVTVTGTQRVVEVKIDKKVYNVDKDPATTGATGLEALQNAPSVNVDVDGNISLRGDEGVRILVNGRPLNIPAKQFLEQTPANNIEKIEVITNPSAKYNPEGTTGLINIILKKNTQKGINGSINSTFGYGIYAKNNNGINLNYRINKFNAFVNVGNNNSKRASGGTTERIFNIGNDSTVNQFIDEDNFRINNSLNAKAGLDYFYDENNVFYFSGGLNGGNDNGESLLNSFFYNQNGENLNQFSNRISTNNGDNSSYNFNGGWQHKFAKENHTLDIDLNYSGDSRNNFEDNEETFRNGSDGSINSISRVTQSEFNEGSLFFGKADYVLPITDSIRFEAGINVTKEQPTNGVTRSMFNDSTQQFEIQDNFTNVFSVTRDILAFYSTVSLQKKKFGYKFGLRAENTVRNSELESGGDFKKSYLSFFPSTFVTYKLGKSTELQASYSRRLNRPNLFQLNPFISSSDPYNTRNGNPFLNPEFINNFELGASNYWKKFSLTGTVYYRQVNDLVRRFITLTDDGVNNVSYKNQSQSSTIGNELIVTYTPNKRFRSSLDFNGWISTFVLDSTDQGGNNTLKSYNINSATSYSFENGISLQANIRYNARFRVQQGVIDPRYGLDLSARIPVLDKKGTISLRFTDVLNTRQFAFRSQNLDYTFDILRKWETRVAYISFSYTFGKQFKQRKRDSGGRDGGGYSGGNDGGF